MDSEALDQRFNQEERDERRRDRERAAKIDQIKEKLYKDQGVEEEKGEEMRKEGRDPAGAGRERDREDRASPGKKKGPAIIVYGPLD